MAKYIFILRKNEIEIELSSTDPGFISKQMKAWQDVFMPGLSGSVPTRPVPRKITPIIKPALNLSPTPSIVEQEQQIVIDESENLIKEIETNLQAVTETLTPELFTEPEMLEVPVVEEPIIEVSVMEEPVIEEIPMVDTEVISAEVESMEVDLAEMLTIEGPEPDSIELEPEVVEQQDPEVALADFEMDDSIEAPAVPPEVDDDMDGLFENLQTEMSSQTEIDEVTIPENVPEEVMHDMSDLLSQFDTEEPVDDQPEELDHIETIVEPDFVEEFQPTIIETGETVVEEDEFDAVLSAMADEIETEEEPIAEEVVLEESPSIEEVLVEEASAEEDDLFEKLEAAAAIEVETKPAKPEIPKPVAEPQVSIENYINSLTLKTPIDLLLATAYYMESFEELEKFTTKDISARTFKVFKRPVSPNIVLAAVNKGYIEVVPDFTGTAESNEYSLTESGRNFVLENLS